MMTKHENNGKCSKCDEIKNRYPGFNEDLWLWFRMMQKSYPELHISCAGRDEQEQTLLLHKKATRAPFGKSAHNYGAALDLFFNIPGSSDIYPISKFHAIVKPNLPHWIEWYGDAKAVFYELPHIEIKAWRTLLADGKLSLIGNGVKNA